MTKRELLAKGLFKYQVEIADALGISRQAVCNWPMDGQIPELQWMKLKYEVLPKFNERKSGKK